MDKRQSPRMSGGWRLCVCGWQMTPAHWPDHFAHAGICERMCVCVGRHGCVFHNANNSSADQSWSKPPGTATGGVTQGKMNAFDESGVECAGEAERLEAIGEVREVAQRMRRST